MKKILLMVLCLCVAMGAVMLTGCADGGGSETDEPEVISYDVILYYVNQEYVDTGDEDLPQLIEKVVTIHVPEGENPVIFLMKALSVIPDESLGTVVTDEIIINDIYPSEEDNETIVVDLGSEGLSGGSMSEGLFISQVVETLLANTELFETETGTLSKVRFLVDGEIVESLMGHIDATEPFGSQLN